jgi:hypothetical protein
MNKRELVKALAIATVGLLGPLVSTSIVLAGGTSAGDQSANADPIPSTGPVPRANCGPRDRTESGLQGRPRRKSVSAAIPKAVTTAT